MEEFDTSDTGAHAHWPDRFFARLVDTYLTRTSNRGGLVGNAECAILECRGLLAFALGVMAAVAADAGAADRLLPEALPG
jgi:hypothetical protein